MDTRGPKRAVGLLVLQLHGRTSRERLTRQSMYRPVLSRPRVSSVHDRESQGTWSWHLTPWRVGSGLLL